jgi:pimeloyl-ACP methyl ester carboxylesterase
MLRASSFPDTRSIYRTAAGHTALHAWYTAGLNRLAGAYESICVPTRFGTTHMLAAGDRQAPAVLLITTWGGNALLWEMQFFALAQHFRVYALDVPGYTGWSAPHHLSPLGSDYADWVADVLDALALAEVALIGMAYGAWIAIQATLALPERITRLGLLSPTFFAPISFGLMGQVANISLNPFLSLDTKLRQFATAVLAPSGLTPHRDLLPVVEWFALLMQHTRQHTPQLAPLRPLLFQPPLRELSRLPLPTLVLFGAHEVMYDAQIALVNAQRSLPNLVRGDILADAGHALIYNQPTLVNQHILAFLMDR